MELDTMVVDEELTIAAVEREGAAKLRHGSTAMVEKALAGRGSADGWASLARCASRSARGDGQAGHRVVEVLLLQRSHRVTYRAS